MIDVQLNPFQGEEHRPFILNGDKGAVLLVHGFPGSPRDMRDIAELVHNHGWTAKAILLPGFGADIEHITDYTNKDWVATVHAQLLDLQRDHKRVILVGHSLGGAISVQVAAQIPPDALILAAPFWKFDHIAWKAIPIVNILFPRPRLFKYLRLDYSKPDVRDGIHNFMPDADLDDPEVRKAIANFRLPVKTFAQIHRAGHAAYADAPKITCETLVLQGQQDDLVSPKLTQEFVHRLGVKSRYVEVDAEHDLVSSELPSWSAMQNAIITFIQHFQQEVCS
ncbi:MAG: alpha/beta fold hydrolase [Aggregatilineales bacterium]